MNVAKIGMGIALLVFLSGCQHQARIADALPPEQAVEQRATARWQLMVARQWREAYDFLSPGARSVTDADSYARSMDAPRHVQWTGASVSRVECSGPERCVATVVIQYRLVSLGAVFSNHQGRNTVTETWLRLDGQWYLVPDRGIG